MFLVITLAVPSNDRKGSISFSLHTSPPGQGQLYYYLIGESDSLSFCFLHQSELTEYLK